MILDEDNGDGKDDEYIWKIFITIIAFQVGESVADKIELVLHCVPVFVIRYLNLMSFVEFVLAVEWQGKSNFPNVVIIVRLRSACRSRKISVLD